MLVYGDQVNQCTVCSGLFVKQPDGSLICEWHPEDAGIPPSHPNHSSAIRKAKEALEKEMEELNIIMATVVMGWTRITWVEFMKSSREATDEYDALMPDQWAAKENDETRWSLKYDLTHGQEGTRGWTPAETIEEAMLVVEKMKQLGYDFRLHNVSRPSYWQCDFIAKGGCYPCYGETPQLAICRAAAQTVGKK